VICFCWNVWLTTFLEQSPSWEAKSSSPSQEIPCILWNRSVHYLIYNSPSSVPIINQIDPVPTLTSYLKMNLNVIVSSTFMSSKWFLVLGLHHQKFLLTSPIPPTLHIHHPSGSSLDWVMKLTRKWPPDKEGVREYIERGTGWSFSLGMDEGLRTSYPKKT
jgi:hypothetical protein